MVGLSKVLPRIIAFLCTFVFFITFIWTLKPTQNFRFLDQEQRVRIHTNERKHTNSSNFLYRYLTNLFSVYEESSDRQAVFGSFHSDETNRMSGLLNVEIEEAKSLIPAIDPSPACDSNVSISNSCQDKCLRLGLSDVHSERIHELLSPANLQLSEEAWSAIEHMRSQISGKYDTILLTGASSNHFLESQAMLKNVHEILFPHLTNFTLIYYNLGLTHREKQQLLMYCNCTVVDFPFHLFPSYFQDLFCYSWKPFMIKAHVQQSNVLMWMDACVRFENASKVHKLLKLTKERGIQIPGPSEKSPFRTARTMYHFFGDEPCSYLQMGQLHGGFGFYKNDPFIERVILEPWTACAWNKSCMCPGGFKQRDHENVKMARKWREEGGQVVYGLMHRFDQSAISLIVHKVYYTYYYWVMFEISDYGIDFKRENKYKYFDFLSTRAKSFPN